MNNMKRLIAIVMVMALALCFVACTQPTENPGTTTTKAPESSSSSKSEPASSTTKPAQPADPDYIIYVVDQDGNPVAGVTVILCDNNKCLMHQTTDEAGVVNYYNTGALDGPMAKVLVAAGYTFVEDYTPYADGENTVTLTVTKIAE